MLWRKDGTCFPVEYLARPLLEDGELRGAIVSFRDISERRAARLALEESHDRLDFVLRAARVGAWEWEIAADHIVWDETTAAHYGLPPGGGEGPWSAFDACIHPDDLDAVNAAADRAIERDEPYEVEFRVVRDGAVAFLAERGQVRRDEQGAVVALAGVTWDVTERREAQEELRFTTFLVEHAADIVFWMTADGEMRYANRTARRASGTHSRSSAAMTIHDIDPGFPRERWPEHIDRAARGRVADLRVDPPAQGRDDAAGGDHGDVRGVRRRGLRRRLLPRHHRAARRGGRAAQVQGA